MTQGFGLETLGVRTERGAIVTDEHMQTNVPGVYAVGDCNGRLMLAHAAYRQAEVAVHHICGVSDSVSQSVVPSVIYTPGALLRRMTAATASASSSMTRTRTALRACSSSGPTPRR